MYAELIGNYKSQRIKSLQDNKLYNSEYGKLRTCEYLPIALCDYDEDGEVIPYNVKNGFESRYIKEILYDGAKSTEEMPAYVMNAPEIPEINKSAITDRIYAMAQKYINK